MFVSIIDWHSSARPSGWDPRLPARGVEASLHLRIQINHHHHISHTVGCNSVAALASCELRAQVGRAVAMQRARLRNSARANVVQCLRALSPVLLCVSVQKQSTYGRANARAISHHSMASPTGITPTVRRASERADGEGAVF